MVDLFADDDVLYGALIARDPAFDGRAYVGVSSTGIFCRLTCPARKPKRENCRFFGTPAACLEAGYRPCKRCRPLASAAEGDATAEALLSALEAEPERRWRESDVIRLGFDPSTARRSFKQRFGLTFLEMARLRRLRGGFASLSSGGRVIDAQLEAGFSSPSGFRDAFARLLGLPPGAFVAGGLLRADWIDTPLGPMIAVSGARALHLLEFVERKALPSELRKLRAAARGDLGLGRYEATDRIEAELKAFFAGDNAAFETPLSQIGGAFSQTVWRALREVPAGETVSYSELAARIGRPDAVRAVARANGANQIAVVVPCHRVVGVDGALTGYGGGLWRKQRLIEFENAFRSPEMERRRQGIQ